MKRIVVLSGSGISAESGIPTFRASDGLWEGHSIEDVATPEGWHKNPELVLEFYNQRRKNALNVKPNAGHTILADLEKDFEVIIITQNVDNLHEQAGSTKVLHLHGEIFKVRSTADENIVLDIKNVNPNGWELRLGDKCPLGSQLRPHIVWFGEEVPNIVPAAKIAAEADVFVVVGTSLVIYPAAGLLDEVVDNTPVFVIDPNLPKMSKRNNLHLIEEKASTGMEKFKNWLYENK